MSLLLAVVTVVAGCTFSPRVPPSGKITCSVDGDCPPATVCAGGLCRTAVIVTDGGDDPFATVDRSTGTDQMPPVDQIATTDVPDDGPVETAADTGAPGGDGGPDRGAPEVAGSDWPICMPPAAAVDLDTGLTVYLLLDEGGGNPVILDSSPNHSETAVTGLPTGASWQPGRFGNALSLAGGASGGWVTIGEMPTMAPAINSIANGISLSVWAKFPPGTPSDGVLLARRAAGPSGYLYRISVSAGRLRVEFHTKNSSHADFSGNQLLPTDGRWMHLGVSYSSVGPGIELFVNGESFGKTAFALQFGPELTALLVGAEENAAAPMPTTTIDRRLTGTIDEVAVYNRALTAEQVKALACGARP